MSRLPDWNSRLVDYLSSVARMPWRPGSHDCVTFASGWREAITGVDLLGDHRGSYRSLEQGFAMLHARGWADHVEAVTQGLVECRPELARIGDLVVVPNEVMHLAMAGCGGAAVHVLTPRGLGVAPLTAAVRAWRL